METYEDDGDDVTSENNNHKNTLDNDADVSDPFKLNKNNLFPNQSAINQKDVD